MAVLFWVMAAVAEDFLVPALEVGGAAVLRCAAAVLRCAAAALCCAAMMSIFVLITCPFCTANAACFSHTHHCPTSTYCCRLHLALCTQQFLAHWLHMAPDVAGVTLFAFASGAPDLFTQIAAVAAGGHVDQELAIRWVGLGRSFGGASRQNSGVVVQQRQLQAADRRREALLMQCAHLLLCVWGNVGASIAVALRLVPLC